MKIYVAQLNSKTYPVPYLSYEKLMAMINKLYPDAKCIYSTYGQLTAADGISEIYEIDSIYSKLYIYKFEVEE